MIAGVLGRAGEAGQKQRLTAAAQGEITYIPARGLVVPGTEDQSAEAQEALQGAATDEDLADPNELSRKLDEVQNRESHRTKGGRDIKRSS